MNPTEIRKAISIAKEATDHIDNQDLRIRTYGIVLNNLLGKKEITTMGSSSHTRLATESKIAKSTYELLSSKVGCKTEDIEDIIELKDDVTLLFPIKRDSTIEEQAIFLLVYLTVKKVCLNEKEVSSSHLREIMSIKQISNLNSLSTNIKKLPSLFVHKSGKKGSTKTTYRITQKGVSKGLKLIKDIATNGQQESIDISFLGNRVRKRKKGSPGLSNEINQLYLEGLFNQPIPTKDVVKELKRRGFFNRRQDVDAYLRKVLLGEKLIRDKMEGIWHYVIKK
jgi:hypothetical protein